MRLMEGKGSSARGSYWPIIPKWVDIQTCIITCSATLRAMRFLPLVLLVTLAGCSRAERLSSQPAEATAQVQRWIAVGTSATDARRAMEQRGFTCSLVTNGTFGTLRGVDYVYCDRREGSVTQQRWQAALVLVESNVSAVHVTTGLVGP